MNIVELKTRTSHFDFTLFFVLRDHIRIVVNCAQCWMHIISFQERKRFIYLFFFGAARSNLAMSMIIHTPFSGLQLFDFVRWTNFHVRKKNVCIKQKEKEINLNFTYIIALIAPHLSSLMTRGNRELGICWTHPFMKLKFRALGQQCK